MSETETGLYGYLGSDDFKQRCATVRTRQKAGEIFSLEEIAQMLDLPHWLVWGSCLRVAQKLGCVFAPGPGEMQ